MKTDLVFLTRDACVSSPEMTKNLDDAMREMERPLGYRSLDIGTLAKTDPRTGYPTPTILWKGKDLFGMLVPKAPYDAPS
jgi:hypothetical protein